MDEEAKTRALLETADLQLILAIARSGTLLAAGKRLGVDQSTVFRSLQKLEKRLGTVLFERSRTGCQPTETADALARHAERIETELEAARVSAGGADGPVQGLVRISTTDVLRGIVIAALGSLKEQEPLLRYALFASYRLANLSKRDTDIALRATKTPPEHMIGKSLGPIREAVFACKAVSDTPNSELLQQASWIELDEPVQHQAASDWRKRVAPNAHIILRVGSIQAAFDAVVSGLGVAILPIFMCRGREDLVRLSDDIKQSETQLWLLAHPESRNLRRVSVVYRHLADSISVE